MTPSWSDSASPLGPTKASPSRPPTLQPTLAARPLTLSRPPKQVRRLREAFHEPFIPAYARRAAAAAAASGSGSVAAPASSAACAGASAATAPADDTAADTATGDSSEQTEGKGAR